MHAIDPIAIAIPVFLAAIWVEATVARRRGLRVYRFFDAIGDLSCGIGNQTVGLLIGLVSLAVYVWTFHYVKIVRFAPGSPWPWIIGFVGLDFLYYWWHRASHTVNFLWAAHIVHHQSEDYNYAVALRQAWFTPFTSIFFYLPLAMFGVDQEIFILSNSVSLLYQFWIHTEVIRRIDPFEWVLNTPSHHRVHHATNPEYLDKNYGGILIIWDRMFGTFEPERAPCVYGITKPFASTNPVWANFHYWAELFRHTGQVEGFGNKLATFFRPPGFDERLGRVVLPPFVPRESFQKYAPPRPTRALTTYVNVNFLLVAAAVMMLILFHNAIPLGEVAIIVAVIVATTVSWSALFEQRRWAWPFEAARIAATLVVAVWVWHAAAAA
jgi:sterol desaturase/sphingolipid hydroxylase (fatty acid hydroxylase superfamily)